MPELPFNLEAKILIGNRAFFFSETNKSSTHNLKCQILTDDSTRMLHCNCIQEDKLKETESIYNSL